MICSHAQNLISAFIDCEMDAEEKRELRQHLFYCQECSIIYQEFLNLKNCLENMTPEPLCFDPISNLHLRLANEEHSLVRQVGRFFWFSRAGLVTACLSVFFISTWVLFPANINQDTTPRLANNSKIDGTNQTTVPSNRPRNPKVPMNTVSMDQDLSIDQPVTIYQASMILP